MVDHRVTAARPIHGDVTTTDFATACSLALSNCIFMNVNWKIATIEQTPSRGGGRKPLVALKSPMKGSFHLAVFETRGQAFGWKH